MPGLRTLIVDDDRDFAESIADLMEMLGHRPQLAHDGRRAVERFREQRFDVVLMDVRMPEMNGIEAFKAVKGIDPDANVVLMTGFSMDQDLADAVAAGALGVMHKPVDMQALEVLLGKIRPDRAVLVVDDDCDFAASIRDSLELAGCHVLVAGTGEEGLQRIDEESIDLVILDLRLPGMNGMEVLQRLRTLGNDVPVIVLTAYEAEDGGALSGLVSGTVTAVLGKPVDPDVLKQAVVRATGWPG